MTMLSATQELAILEAIERHLDLAYHAADCAFYEAKFRAGGSHKDELERETKRRVRAWGRLTWARYRTALQLHKVSPHIQGIPRAPSFGEPPPTRDEILAEREIAQRMRAAFGVACGPTRTGPHLDPHPDPHPDADGDPRPNSPEDVGYGR